MTLLELASDTTRPEAERGVLSDVHMKITRLEGEANVLRDLLRKTTDVIDTLIDDDDDSEGTGLLAALKEKCIAAIAGVPA